MCSCHLVDVSNFFVKISWATFLYLFGREEPTQPAFTCSKLTIETLGQGVKYVQS